MQEKLENRFYLPCSGDIKLLQKVVHDQDRNDYNNKPIVGKANDKQSADHVVELIAEHTQVHRNGDI